MAESSYELAIVGAGFSGPVLAANLAEKGIHPRSGELLKIALIQAGPYLKGTPRSGSGAPLRRQRFTNIGGSTDPTLHWEDGSARLVGGSSLHWQGSAFLPFPIDDLHWQQETGVDWTQENFREAVEETRREFNIHEYPEKVNTRGNRLFDQCCRSDGIRPAPADRGATQLHLLRLLRGIPDVHV